MFFLEKHLFKRSEIKGMNREDKYDIPIEALREAVVNAIIHRDYSMTGTSVSVEIFDDRVQIVNPGGLVKGVTPENLGQVSIRRNEIIADMFNRMHKSERAGRGIKKIRDLMNAEKMEQPEFKSDAMFWAVFKRDLSFAGTVEKTREKTREKIIALVKGNPIITTLEIAEIAGISIKGVEWNLKKLKDEVVIKRNGPDKGGYWEVVKPRTTGKGGKA
jgi:ATP-dependent DNA helicase RecG